MQTSERTRPVPILFDSSLEDGIDQVLALALVLASTARRESRLGSLSVSRNSLHLARFCDLMVRFYRGEQPGTVANAASVPIGMFAEEAALPAPDMIEGTLNRTGPDGRALYPRGIEKFNDTADPVAVLRNALSAQQDREAVIILAGPPVNLLGLLAIPEGPALVRNKVRSLVIASDDARAGARVAELRELWPAPIARAGDDVNLLYPATAIDQDFTWAPNHPVVDAYRSAGTMPYDTSMRATAAALYAAYPDAGYFGLSDAATGDAPRHRQLTATAEQRGRAEAAIRDLVCTMPPEPARRPAGGQG